MDAPALSPPDQHTRLIRSYALHEDAERARAELAENLIGSAICDIPTSPAKNGNGVYRGCTLSVAPGDAAAATRLLLRMPPSEAPNLQRATNSKPGERGTSRPESSPSRLIRRSGPPEKQRGNFLMISFAVACAAGAVLLASYFMLKPKEKYQPPRLTNFRVEEDLNGDTLPDVIREFSPRWEPLYHAEDRNFDDELDIQWTYQRGRPAYRDVDVNYDGKFDERTTFDREGQPYFSDLRPAGSGPVLRRLVYRHGLLWKVLEDRNADFKFDHMKEYDRFATVTKEEELPPDSAENGHPQWPPPEWPDDEDQAPKLLINPGK